MSRLLTRLPIVLVAASLVGCLDRVQDCCSVAWGTMRRAGDRDECGTSSRCWPLCLPPIRPIGSRGAPHIFVMEATTLPWLGRCTDTAGAVHSTERGRATRTLERPAEV